MNLISFFILIASIAAVFVVAAWLDFFYPGWQNRFENWWDSRF